MRFIVFCSRSRQTLKPGALVTTTQNITVAKQETVVIRNGYTPSTVSTSSPGNDIDKLRAQINPTDVELLYSRLPADAIPSVDYEQPLTEDQQLLHDKLIGAELERQDYVDDDDDDDDDNDESYEQ